MKHLFFLVAGAVFLFAMGQVQAGDASAGRAKAKACVSCHGANGNSASPTVPRIGGQYESYLLYALRAYKSEDRKNPIMVGLVADLSDQDLKDLAAYYAEQGGVLYVPSPR